MTPYWSRHLCKNISFTQKCSRIWAEYCSDISEVCCNFYHSYIFYCEVKVMWIRLQWLFKYFVLNIVHMELWNIPYIFDVGGARMCFSYFIIWLALLMVCYVLNSAVFVSDIFLVTCSVGKTYIPYIHFFPIYLRSFGVAHKFSHLLQVHKFFLHNSPGLFRYLGMKNVTIVTDRNLLYLLLWQHSTFSAICG